MKRTILMKIDVGTLYQFIRKKSPRHIDPKIPSHGGGFRFHHIPQQLFFLRCWATRLGTFLCIVVFQRSRSPEGRGGGLNGMWTTPPSKGQGVFKEKIGYTPWKINVEPTNHPLRKGKWSSKPPWLCSMLIFRGVYTPDFYLDPHGVPNDGKGCH